MRPHQPCWHEKIPLFNEISTSIRLLKSISTSIRLLKSKVVCGQRQPELAATEISADSGDYTVIIVMEVDPQDQTTLTEAMALPDEWILTVPGLRSHSILRGIDGTFVVNYAQWESKKLCDAFPGMTWGGAGPR